MERMTDLKEISDGRLYSSNDMARIDCGGCVGCSACCRGRGDSVLLDPLDCVRLEQTLSVDFAGLLAGYAELGMADGLIFPHLKMQSGTQACPFLDEGGRCSVYEVRPGFCRMFPLGRYYHDRTFSYILQTHECAKKNRAKMKIKKWLGVPDLQQYERYVQDWHDYWKELEASLPLEDHGERKQAAMGLLQQFYVKPWIGEDFYGEFYRRMEKERSRRV